jgi:signal transduction histidine kinase
MADPWADLAAELDSAFLTNGLTPQQRDQLVAAADRVDFAAGETLFTEGSPADHLWILLEGTIELSRGRDGDATVLAMMTMPGQWAGGLAAWGDAGAATGYRTTGHAVTSGRCLAVHSDRLGALVGEWFPFGRHMIVGIFQTVRSIEATARQRESLVALGTLAAGLAHEINNPAAASLRAVVALREETERMLQALARLAESTITADQFVRLEQLRVEASAQAMDGSVGSLGPLAVADREESLGTWLHAHGLESAWDLAPMLAARGVDAGWCARVEAVTPGVAFEPALQWIAGAVAVDSLLDDLTETTTRISRLVSDVRSYSQLDRAALQRIDVREGIESTLSMLAPKLVRVLVRRDFAPDAPHVEAFAAELNQVWTNLVENAVDAMRGEGTIVISTRRDEDALVVDIADDGPGMPPEVQERAFEPFFTTKDVGRGTGLGLDISRRIVVDRHGGAIWFDSGPTGTIAHVRLPLAR